jgi:hypothetical protein
MPRIEPGEIEIALLLPCLASAEMELSTEEAAAGVEVVID